MLKGFEMELLKKFSDDYRKAKKRDKGDILNQYCKLARCSRWAAIKRFGRYFIRPKKEKRCISIKKGRRQKYNILSKNLIKEVWEFSGYLCGERLYPMLNTYIRQLQENKKLIDYPEEELQKVKNIPLGSLKKSP